MPKVLIDCGAHNGNILELLIEKLGPFDRIYAFECNPEFKKYPPNVTYMQAAVWTKNGEIDFYLSPLGTKPSSLLKEKTTGKLDIEHPIKVRCIDFSQWLKNTITKYDHVTMKMNIEGAEYDVLEKLIKDETIKLIDALYVSFHRSKLDLPDLLKRENSIKTALTFRNISISDWGDLLRGWIRERKTKKANS